MRLHGAPPCRVCGRTKARRERPRPDGCRRRRDRGCRCPRCGCAAGTRRFASATARARRPHPCRTAESSWKSQRRHHARGDDVLLKAGQRDLVEDLRHRAAVRLRHLAPVGAAVEMRNGREHVERIAAGRRQRRIGRRGTMKIEAHVRREPLVLERYRSAARDSAARAGWCGAGHPRYLREVPKYQTNKPIE